MIVNPGSVGLQLNLGSPDARYAIVELRDGRYYPSFYAVPYDHFAVARQAEANGFPQWRDALVTGLRSRGHKQAMPLDGPENLAPLIKSLAKPDDYVVCLGAGSITQWAYALPAELKAL